MLMRRILIVEHSAALAKLWKQTFKLNVDYEIILCSTAPAALDLLDCETFDIVVTDLFVPGGSGGLGVLLKIFTMDEQRPPVIAVTGEKVPSVMSCVNNVYLEQADRLGAARTLLKPFPAAELFLAVEELLAARTVSA